MYIDLTEAIHLKKVMDAAYKIFKNTPNHTSANEWSNATRDFNTYCVRLVKELIEDQEGTADHKEEILANIEEYKTCKTCNSELVFLVDKENYIASSELVEDFPGWCYSCLLDHCLAQDCETCPLVKDHTKCSFKEIKNAVVVDAEVLTADGHILSDRYGVHITAET